MVQVGWQIQQRNFRLGASAPIGNREQSTRSPRTPLLQHHTSFSFSFSVRRRSFPLNTAASVVGFTLLARLPCQTLFLCLRHPGPRLDSTWFPPLLGPNNRNSKKLLAPVRPPPSPLLVRRPHCSLFAQTQQSQTRVYLLSSPPRICFGPRTHASTNNTNPPPLVSPWPTPRLWSAVTATFPSRPP